MSDDNVNLQESEEQVVNELASEALEASGDVEGEESSPSSVEAQEQDLIDLDSMTQVTQTPSEESTQHELNRKHAALRIRQKEIKQRLEENKFTPDATELKKPRRIDFVNQDRLYDDFGGDVEVARAAYEDALDDYNEQVNSSVSTQRNKTQAEYDQLEALAQVESEFEASTKAISSRVAGLDNKLAKADEFLGYENALAIKQQYKDAAPLMLAMLGSSRELSSRITSITEPATLFRELAKLESQALKAMTPTKTLSTAPEEVAVSGESSSIRSLEKAMSDAADDPAKFDEYMRLKKQLKTLRGQR